jgi:hypothetical protein
MDLYERFVYETADLAGPRAQNTTQIIETLNLFREQVFENRKQRVIDDDKNYTPSTRYDDFGHSGASLCRMA